MDGQVPPTRTLCFLFVPGTKCDVHAKEADASGFAKSSAQLVFGVPPKQKSPRVPRTNHSTTVPNTSAKPSLIACASVELTISRSSGRVLNLRRLHDTP